MFVAEILFVICFTLYMTTQGTRKQHTGCRQCHRACWRHSKRCRWSNRRVNVSLTADGWLHRILNKHTSSSQPPVCIMHRQTLRQIIIIIINLYSAIREATEALVEESIRRH